MNAPYITSQFGAKIPKRYTRSFYHFIRDAGDNHLLLGYIQILDKFLGQDDKDKALEKIKQLASDPNNVELNKLSEEYLDAVSTKIFEAETYELILSQMTFCRLVDNFLSYLKEILSEVSKVEPSFFLLLQKAGKTSLPGSDKLLRKLFYSNAIDIMNFFTDKLAVDIPEDELTTLTTFIKERNIIVHNRATVSDELIQLKPVLNSQKNRHFYYRYHQLEGILIFLNNVANDIDNLLADKYGLALYGSNDA